MFLHQSSATDVTVVLTNRRYNFSDEGQPLDSPTTGIMAVVSALNYKSVPEP